MPDRARQGLDLLLAHYPEAEVALVIHQRHARYSPTTRPPGQVSPVLRPPWEESPGPWTCVDLIVEQERRQFAIWNYNGDVYRVTGAHGQYPGAVEDDPFLTVVPT